MHEFVHGLGPLAGNGGKLTNGQFHEGSGCLCYSIWVWGVGKPESGLSGPQQRSLGQCASLLSAGCLVVLVVGS